RWFGVAAREAGGNRRSGLDSISLLLSEPHNAAVARDDGGASAAGEIHGYSAATCEQERAGADEARLACRGMFTKVGADSARGAGRFDSYFVYRGIPGRDQAGFQDAVRFREGRGIRLDGRVCLFG